MQERPGVKPRLKYNIKSKEILITDTPNSKIVTLKNATIRINRYKIAHVPVMKLSAAQGGGFVTFKRDEKTGIPRLTTVATAEESSLIETTFPEFGHLSELGAFVGYGHVFDLKNGGTLKAVPLFSWGDGKRNDIGFGGMVRYMDTTNKTELYYSTLKDKILLEGEQRIFTPNTKLIYGANSYIENGFFGLQKPDYVVEIVDSRSLIKAYNFDFNLRSSGGYVESIDSNFALGRFQLQGSLRNIAPFWRYKDYLTIGAGANAHLGLYGNGATYGVARIGPHVGSTLGPLDIWAAYYQGAIGGESPLLFDRYQHGKSNVTFHSSLRVSKYLTLAYGTSLNLTKDSWEKKLMIENQVYMWVGPEDFKIKLGYDIERERTLFGIDMLVGAEDSAIDFEKLKVKQKL
ncbi:MAG: hypothetical protein GX568_06130 [Candidatus Gastranaerophilales bacterium]|nr:hypothetical protein [Candidatus Gastranaerophilales bacterium]